MPNNKRSDTWEVAVGLLSLLTGFIVGYWVHEHTTKHWLTQGSDPFAICVWVAVASATWWFAHEIDN